MVGLTVRVTPPLPPWRSISIRFFMPSLSPIKMNIPERALYPVWAVDRWGRHHFWHSHPGPTLPPHNSFCKICFFFWHIFWVFCFHFWHSHPDGPTLPPHKLSRFLQNIFVWFEAFFSVFGFQFLHSHPAPGPTLPPHTECMASFLQNQFSLLGRNDPKEGFENLLFGEVRTTNWMYSLTLLTLLTWFYCGNKG